MAVATVRKSTAAASWRCVRRNVAQDGPVAGFPLRCRTMYFATVDRATSIPSLASSAWMRGAPQRRLAWLMSRIRIRSSCDTCGRPLPGLLFQRQNSLKLVFCQPITAPAAQGQATPSTPSSALKATPIVDDLPASILAGQLIAAVRQVDVAAPRSPSPKAGFREETGEAQPSSRRSSRRLIRVWDARQPSRLAMERRWCATIWAGSAESQECLDLGPTEFSVGTPEDSRERALSRGGR